MKRHIKFVVISFAVVVVIIAFLFANSMTIRGTILSVGESEISGKSFDTLLIDVDSSGRINCDRLYLYYNGKIGLNVGDKIIALYNPHIMVSDPPYVFSRLLFRIGKASS